MVQQHLDVDNSAVYESAFISHTVHAIGRKRIAVKLTKTTARTACVTETGYAVRLTLHLRHGPCGTSNVQYVMPVLNFRPEICESVVIGLC